MGQLKEVLERLQGEEYANGVLIPCLLARGVSRSGVREFAERVEELDKSTPFKAGIIEALVVYGDLELQEDIKCGNLEAMRRVGFVG
jgi:hypothetical protein